MLATPKIVILDSSTLGKVSRDYWSQDANARDKARVFVAELKRLGIFVAFTLNHICELLRHGNEEVVLNRLKFLRSIPLIAWLRPYDSEWLSGGISDLLCHELHTVVYDSAQNWQEIIDKARPTLWETGVGHEMFVEDDNLWLHLMRESKQHHETEKHVASVDRTDPGQIRDIKIREFINLPILSKEEQNAYLDWFTQEMQRQLDCHGDKRLECSSKIAIDFVSKALQNSKGINEMDGNNIQELLKYQGVPNEFVSPEMTIGELWELTVYAKRLKMIAKNLHPPIELTMEDIPLDTLPSYSLERKLASIQRKAEKVSGSDMGDRHIIPLIFYADGIEVDKRTYEYIKQVRRNEPELALLMGHFFRSSDYSKIPSLLDL